MGHWTRVSHHDDAILYDTHTLPLKKMSISLTPKAAKWCWCHTHSFTHPYHINPFNLIGSACTHGIFYIEGRWEGWEAQFCWYVHQTHTPLLTLQGKWKPLNLVVVKRRRQIFLFHAYILHFGAPGSSIERREKISLLLPSPSSSLFKTHPFDFQLPFSLLCVCVF